MTKYFFFKITDRNKLKVHEKMFIVNVCPTEYTCKRILNIVQYSKFNIIFDIRNVLNLLEYF